jgi:hypothetical protein
VGERGGCPPPFDTGKELVEHLLGSLLLRPRLGDGDGGGEGAGGAFQRAVGALRANASAALCNLLLDFSPLKAEAVERGALELLAALARDGAFGCAVGGGGGPSSSAPPATPGPEEQSRLLLLRSSQLLSPASASPYPPFAPRDDAALRLNGVWGLANAAYGASARDRRRVLSALPWAAAEELAGGVGGPPGFGGGGGGSESGGALASPTPAPRFPFRGGDGRVRSRALALLQNLLAHAGASEVEEVCRWGGPGLWRVLRRALEEGTALYPSAPEEEAPAAAAAEAEAAAEMMETGEGDAAAAAAAAPAAQPNSANDAFPSSTSPSASTTLALLSLAAGDDREEEEEEEEAEDRRRRKRRQRRQRSAPGRQQRQQSPAVAEAVYPPLPSSFRSSPHSPAFETSRASLFSCARHAALALANAAAAGREPIRAAAFDATDGGRLVAALLFDGGGGGGAGGDGGEGGTRPRPRTPRSVQLAGAWLALNLCAWNVEGGSPAGFSSAAAARAAESAARNGVGDGAAGAAGAESRLTFSQRREAARRRAFSRARALEGAGVLSRLEGLARAPEEGGEEGGEEEGDDDDDDDDDVGLSEEGGAAPGGGEGGGGGGGDRRERRRPFSLPPRASTDQRQSVRERAAVAAERIRGLLGDAGLAAEVDAEMR